MSGIYFVFCFAYGSQKDKINARHKHIHDMANEKSNMNTILSNRQLFFITLILITIMTVNNSCKSTSELATEESVEVEKYMGTWYEIARLPNSFEKDMKCVTATYSLKKNGKINVFNKGFKTTKNKYSTAKGIAKIPNSEYPGKLKVSFFRPFWGNYYIIELDKNYQYVLVGDPTRKYLWILSRTSTLNEATYNMLVNIAKKKGFNTNILIKTKHDCEK